MAKKAAVTNHTTPTTTKPLYQRLCPNWAGVGLTAILAIAGGMFTLGGCIYTQITAVLGTVNSHDASLKSLPDLKKELTDFRSETTTARDKATKELHDVDLKVAELKGLPGLVKAATDALADERKATAVTNAETKLAAASLTTGLGELASVKADVAAIKASLAEAQAKLAGIKPIAADVAAAKETAARIEAAGNNARLTSEVRVSLPLPGKKLADAGQFQRTQYQVPLGSIAILADPEKRKTLHVDGARVFATSPEIPIGAAAEPSTDHGEGTLTVTLWIDKAEKPLNPTEPLYALLNVSWGEP